MANHFAFRSALPESTFDCVSLCLPCWKWFTIVVLPCGEMKKCREVKNGQMSLWMKGFVLKIVYAHLASLCSNSLTSIVLAASIRRWNKHAPSLKFLLHQTWEYCPSSPSSFPFLDEKKTVLWFWIRTRVLGLKRAHFSGEYDVYFSLFDERYDICKESLYFFLYNE